MPSEAMMTQHNATVPAPQARWKWWQFGGVGFGLAALLGLLVYAIKR